MKSRLYPAALFGCGLFTVLHVIALPMLMTYDGGDYVKLGLTWPQCFPDSWDFGRTPLYPLMLRVSFWLFGRQSVAAIIPTVLFGLVGTWALASAVRRFAGKLSVAVIVVLTLYPTLIVYEHSVLTEAGSFMFLALIVNWATWRPAEPWRKTAALAAGTIAIFLFRPTSLVLFPLVASILAIDLAMAHRTLPGTKSWKLTARAVAPHLVVATLVAYLLSMSWSRLSAASGGRDYQGQQMVFGLLKQAVLPPDDPLMLPIRDGYLAAISEATVNGSMDTAGLRPGTHFNLYVQLAPKDDPRKILGHAVKDHPGRYAAGVGRTLMLNLGVPALDSESDSYFQGVVREAETGTKLFLPPGQLSPALMASFRQMGGKSAISDLIGALNAPYRWLLWLGAVMTVIGFAFGCWRRLGGLVVLSGVPLYWIVAHAFSLMSSDRLVLPAHAFLVVNALVVPVLIAGSRELADEARASAAAAGS